MVLPSKVIESLKKQSRKKMLESKKFIQNLGAKQAEIQSKTGKPMSEEDKKAFAQNYIPSKEVMNHMKKAFELENILKNETIRQIVKIRDVKEKKSLVKIVKQLIAINLE